MATHNSSFITPPLSIVPRSMPIVKSRGLRSIMVGYACILIMRQQQSHGRYWLLLVIPVLPFALCQFVNGDILYVNSVQIMEGVCCVYISKQQDKLYYFRVVFGRERRHTSAKLIHTSGTCVISASTRESAISRFLSRFV